MGSAGLIFKNPDDEAKLPTLDFRVLCILDTLRMWAITQQCPTVRITDIDTPEVHQENGPHYRKQAIDGGIEPFGLTKLESFADWINSTYDYGRGYRVMLVGKWDPNGKHNNHWHIQVPPPYHLKGRIALDGVR